MATRRTKKRHIAIFDTTLRDGEQVPGATLTGPEKLEIARQLERLRVDIIEAGFPASSPGDLEAVRRIAQEMRGPVVCALARCVRADIDAAWEAVRQARRPRIHVFLGISDVHLERGLRKTREQGLALSVQMVKYAKRLTEDVEYSPMDATRADRDFLCQLIEATIKAGATTINIPDTVGFATPEEFGGLIREIRERVPATEGIALSVHCHNDLGLATANSLAGVANGATQVECAVNGIGERAGNAALEEVVMALRLKGAGLGVECGVVPRELSRTSRMVSSMMGIPVQPNKAIVGRNAFAHSSGIHQDGILKDRSTFEIIAPEEVGVREHMFVLTSRSGRHALRARLQELGHDLSDAAFTKAYERFLDLADKKKQVLDEDLESIIADEARTLSEIYRLDYLHVVSGGTTIPTATVRLSRNGETFLATGNGVGSVDAVYKTIGSMLKVRHKLLQYHVESVTGGTEALGEVTVRLVSPRGDIYSGRGSSTDIIEASAKAYLQALNKLISEEEIKLPGGERAAGGKK
jgi:2-isopropylmalate synthase